MSYFAEWRNLLVPKNIQSDLTALSQFEIVRGLYFLK